MMRPIYFRMMAWSPVPFASSIEAESLGAPTSFDGQLSFKIGYEGSIWHDVIMANSGVVLVSEAAKRAVEADQLSGARFVDAPIVEVLGSSLRKKPAPRYYRLLAEGLIRIDQAVLEKQARLIPLDSVHGDKSDFFCADHPKGPLGHFCSYRAIESFRRHKVKNLHLQPLDFYRQRLDPFVPPFRIKLNERKWPPKA